MESLSLSIIKHWIIESKKKIKYVLELIKQVERVPVKFLAPMAGYDGLFEIRVEYESNIYRIFCCFGKGQIVVLLNAFQKKDRKNSKKGN
ncbi:MAG: type II toxin-antitoxin system RelE/ParE family toxin [Bacteroidota bacterium]